MLIEDILISVCSLLFNAQNKESLPQRNKKTEYLTQGYTLIL